MPGVVEITNIAKTSDNKSEEKTKKMKKKTKVSATCATENQDQVKVAVEIGEWRIFATWISCDLLQNLSYHSVSIPTWHVYSEVLHLA